MKWKLLIAVIILVAVIVSAASLLSFCIYAKGNLFFPNPFTIRDELDEDYSNIEMVIVISDYSSAYRFMFSEDRKLTVSYGSRKGVRNLFDHRVRHIFEIESMDFMESISIEAEITLSEETHTEIIQLAEEIAETYAENQWILSDSLTLTIITSDTVYETIHWRGSFREIAEML